MKKLLGTEKHLVKRKVINRSIPTVYKNMSNNKPIGYGTAKIQKKSKKQKK